MLYYNLIVKYLLADKKLLYFKFYLTKVLRKVTNVKINNGGRRQVVRRWIVAPLFAGSNPVVRPFYCTYNKHRLFLNFVLVL